MPPLHNAEDGGAAVVFPLGAVWVAHDHGKDPEEGGGPGEEKDGDAEQGREEKHGY